MLGPHPNIGDVVVCIADPLIGIRILRPGRNFRIHHRRFTNLPCASRNDKPPRAITECQSSASPSTTSVRLKSLVKLLSCCNQPQQVDNFAFNLSPTGNTRQTYSDVFDGYLKYHSLPAITLAVQSR